MVGKSTKPFIDEIRNEDGSIDTKAAVVQYLKGILNFLTHARVYYHTMTETEKASLMKAINEILMGLGVIALTSAIAGAVPDDKKDSILYNFPMYVLNGLQAELHGLTPGYGTWKTLRPITSNPAAAIRNLDKVTKLVSESIGYFTDHDNIYYSRGPNKDRLKIEKASTDLIPLWYQINRFTTMTGKNQNQVYSGWIY
jgi:hypothetical protein